MPIKKEIIRGGMRLTHPSGAVAITTLESLQKQKEITRGFINSLQEQIKLIDKNIQEIKNLTT